MTYREDHPTSFYMVCVLCITIAVCAISFFGYKATVVNAEKERIVTEIREHEETERTEERSQFWQKIVPWGSDEEEGDDNQQVVEERAEE